jgi:ATP-dependent RNA helicase RhlE
LTFNDFNFNQLLQEGLDTMGYKEPTPIQKQAIPLILEGKDLIACAQTGTGKTASYLLPILNKINEEKTVGINTLILAPTRELAQQIDQQIEGLAYFTGNSSIAVYGGGDGFNYEQQRRSLNDGVDIIVATPGRLIAHLTSGTIKLTGLKHLILDEADRMMDMGFYDDIVRIISYLPEKRQNLLFSATMPHKIRELTKKILHQPAEVNIEVSKPSVGILQQAYLTFDEQKPKLLRILLKQKEFKSVIIFASRKEIVKKLASSLERSGLEVEAFHSDLDQAQREKILMAFRGKQLQVIIGTDVLSRGIDVAGISLVINYDVPPDPEDYIHRIGRTARAETTGTAITFINQKDQRKFARIEKMIEREIPKIELPEGLGETFVYNPLASGGGHAHSKSPRKWKKKPRPSTSN